MVKNSSSIKTRQSKTKIKFTDLWKFVSELIYDLYRYELWDLGIYKFHDPQQQKSVESKLRGLERLRKASQIKARTINFNLFIIYNGLNDIFNEVVLNNLDKEQCKELIKNKFPDLAANAHNLAANKTEIQQKNGEKHQGSKELVKHKLGLLIGYKRSKIHDILKQQKLKFLEYERLKHEGLFAPDYPFFQNVKAELIFKDYAISAINFDHPNILVTRSLLKPKGSRTTN